MYDNKTIIELWSKTQSIRAIAKETGLARSTIRRRLVDGGIYPTNRSLEIKKYIDQGYTVNQISDILKISINAVSGHIKYIRRPYTGDSATTQWRNEKKRERPT